MSLVNVGRDLCFQRSSKFQIEHRSVRQVEFIRKFSWFSVKIWRVAGHVTDDNGIKNCAQRAKNKSRGKLCFTRPRYNLSNTENIESRVEQDEVLPPESIIAFKKALVSVTLASVHEVHILNPSFLRWNNWEPYARKHMNEYKEDYCHHKNLQVNLNILGQVRALHCREETTESKKFE